MEIRLRKGEGQGYSSVDKPGSLSGIQKVLRILGRGNMIKSNSSSVEVFSLAKSLLPLKDHFNRDKDSLRILALVSPT